MSGKNWEYGDPERLLKPDDDITDVKIDGPVKIEDPIDVRLELPLGAISIIFTWGLAQGLLLGYLIWGS